MRRHLLAGRDWLLVTSVFLSCATAGPVARADEPPPPAPSEVKEASTEDLAASFETGTRPPKAAPGGPKLSVPDAPVPAPAERRAPYRRARDAAQTALKGKRFSEAREAAAEAVTAAGALTGVERAEAGALAFAVEKAAPDLVAAQRAALAWRSACGPEQQEGCRARALAALSSLGTPGATAWARRLREAESCLAQGAHPGPCLAKVEATAKAAGDEGLAAQAALARALDEKTDAAKLAALVKVDEGCSALACLGVRRRALQAEARLGKADPAVVARAVLLDNALAASLLEPELRPWARGPQVDQACASYDASASAGACRALEKELTGTQTFRDFSKEKRVGTELSQDQVRTVNAHYAPLLVPCLQAQARRLTPPDEQVLELRWVVHPDGHVRDAHLRADLDETPVATCLREQFSRWRYPRFDGEFQHVTQTFTVTASRSRGN